MDDKNVFEVLLKEAGMKPAELAERSGVTASTVYAITGGRTKFEKIGVNTFMKLASALDMDAEELYEKGERIKTGVEYAVIDMNALQEDPLENRRRQLLDDYGMLRDEDKRTIERLTSALAELEAMRKQQI